MNPTIAIAGNLVADTVKRIDRYPSPGMLSSILSIGRSVGGSVPNMSVVIRKLDASQSVKGIGLTGNDENGRYLVDTMAEYGVDTTHVRPIDGVNTAFTDVMTVDATGERTFFHARGANARFSYEHVPFDALGDCSIFHIAYALLLDAMDAPDAEYGTVMARTLAEASRRGLTTSMDVVSEEGDRFAAIVTPSLRHCDYLVVNEIESSRVCGIPARDDGGSLIEGNIPRICRALLDAGVRRLVAIHAPEGGWAMGKDGSFCFRPSLSLPKGWIKGTVGAGDAFCAGFLYATNRGETVERALDLGAAAAACNLSHEGSIEGIRPLAEVERMLVEMPRRV